MPPTAAASAASRLIDATAFTGSSMCSFFEYVFKVQDFLVALAGADNQYCEAADATIRFVLLGSFGFLFVLLMYYLIFETSLFICGDNRPLKRGDHVLVNGVIEGRVAEIWDDEQHYQEHRRQQQKYNLRPRNEKVKYT